MLEEGIHGGRLAARVVGAGAESVAALIGELRHATSGVVRAVGEWRSKKRVAMRHFRKMPDEEMPFWHGEEPYPQKMAADVPFLPAPVAHDPLHTAATFIQCRFRGYQTRLLSLANALVPPASAVAAPPSSVIVDGDAAIGLTPEDARQLERLRVEQSAEHSIPCLGFGHTRATFAARRHAQTDWSI